MTEILIPLVSVNLVFAYVSFSISASPDGLAGLYGKKFSVPLEVNAMKTIFSMNRPILRFLMRLFQEFFVLFSNIYGKVVNSFASSK